MTASRQVAPARSAAPSAPSGPSAPSATATAPWDELPARIRARGLRWTPQRRILLEVLSRSEGHVTGAELVERCRAADPSTVPSTVYRTLDVLEELGIVQHAHGADGREEFHVLPVSQHGHLHCLGCHQSWEISSDEAAALGRVLERERGFAMDLSHLTVSGHCRACGGDG